MTSSRQNLPVSMSNILLINSKILGCINKHDLNRLMQNAHVRNCGILLKNNICDSALQTKVNCISLISVLLLTAILALNLKIVEHRHPNKYIIREEINCYLTLIHY